MLLYLNQKTWVEEGEVLERDVRAARATQAGIKIVLVHENDPEKGGCEFGMFFGTTPQELITDGIYSDIAIALHTLPHRAVSLALVAKAVGAVKRTGLAATTHTFSKRKSSDLLALKDMVSSRSKEGSVAIAQVAVTGRISVRNSVRGLSRSGKSKAPPPIDPSTTSTSAAADDHIVVEMQNVEEDLPSKFRAVSASSLAQPTASAAVESRAQEADEHATRASGVSDEEFDAASSRLDDAEAQPRRPSLSLGQAVSSGRTLKNLRPEDSKEEGGR
jgi:hypothetical protein